MLALWGYGEKNKITTLCFGLLILRFMEEQRLTLTALWKAETSGSWDGDTVTTAEV